jgi:predicted  nucleic acid-binding Zn-ribbon protein
MNIKDIIKDLEATAAALEEAKEEMEKRNERMWEITERWKIFNRELLKFKEMMDRANQRLGQLKPKSKVLN